MYPGLCKGMKFTTVLVRLGLQGPQISRVVKGEVAYCCAEFPLLRGSRLSWGWESWLGWGRGPGGCWRLVQPGRAGVCSVSRMLSATCSSRHRLPHWSLHASREGGPIKHGTVLMAKKAIKAGEELRAGDVGRALWWPGSLPLEEMTLELGMNNGKAGL